MSEHDRTQTRPDAAAVATALLGSWPSQVAQWGQEALAAYLAELEARGITPEQALVAIRSWRPANPSKDFPPSASALADFARQDPSVPTFDELLRLLYGPRGVMAARPERTVFADWPERARAYNEAALARAAECHPLVAAFVSRQGVQRLRELELDHEEEGKWRRKELRQAWEEHCEALEGREVAALVSGRREEGLRALDPLAAIGGGPRRELGSGS